MNFKYPDLQTIEFRGMRLYETPEGNFYPSITTVLGKTMSEEKENALKSWQMSLGMDLAQKKTKEAANRGTAVHLLAERFIKGEDLVKPGESFEQSAMTSFNALKLKLKKINPWAQEVALYSDVLGVAGRTDLIGEFNGTPSIIDFKTSSKLKKDSDIEDYKFQLCAYAQMHNEMFGTDISHGVILMTSDGGFPQEFRVDLSKYTDALAKRVATFYREKMNLED